METLNRGNEVNGLLIQEEPLTQPATEEQLLELFKKHLTFKEIERRSLIPKKTLYSRAETFTKRGQKLDIDSPVWGKSIKKVAKKVPTKAPAKVLPDSDHKYLSAFLKGLSKPQIAKQLKISLANVDYYARKFHKSGHPVDVKGLNIGSRPVPKKKAKKVTKSATKSASPVQKVKIPTVFAPAYMNVTLNNVVFHVEGLKEIWVSGKDVKITT